MSKMPKTSKTSTNISGSKSSVIIPIWREPYILREDPQSRKKAAFLDIDGAWQKIPERCYDTTSYLPEEQTVIHQLRTLGLDMIDPTLSPLNPSSSGTIPIQTLPIYGILTKVKSFYQTLTQGNQKKLEKYKKSAPKLFDRLEKLVTQHPNALWQFSLECQPILNEELEIVGYHPPPFPSFQELPPIFSRLKYLDSLVITGFPLMTMSHFPSNLSHLSLTDTLISTFSHLPPYLKSLVIQNSPFLSCDGFPEQMNNLKTLNLFNVPLHTLQGLPSVLPQLRNLIITYANFRSLHNIPQTPRLENFEIEAVPLVNYSGLANLLTHNPIFPILIRTKTIISPYGLPCHPYLILKAILNIQKTVELNHSRVPASYFEHLHLDRYTPEQLSPDKTTIYRYIKQEGIHADIQMILPKLEVPLTFLEEVHSNFSTSPAHLAYKYIQSRQIPKQSRLKEEDSLSTFEKDRLVFESPLEVYIYLLQSIGPMDSIVQQLRHQLGVSEKVEGIIL
jgi:hypothetical protein